MQKVPRHSERERSNPDNKFVVNDIPTVITCKNNINRLTDLFLEKWATIIV